MENPINHHLRNTHIGRYFIWAELHLIDPMMTERDGSKKWPHFEAWRILLQSFLNFLKATQEKDLRGPKNQMRLGEKVARFTRYVGSPKAWTIGIEW